MSERMQSAILEVNFTDFNTVCLSSGKSFELRFDTQSRLTDWNTRDWSNG